MRHTLQLMDLRGDRLNGNSVSVRNVPSLSSSSSSSDAEGAGNPLASTTGADSLGVLKCLLEMNRLVTGGGTNSELAAGQGGAQSREGSNDVKPVLDQPVGEEGAARITAEGDSHPAGSEDALPVKDLSVPQPPLLSSDLAASRLERDLENRVQVRTDGETLISLPNTTAD